VKRIESFPSPEIPFEHTSGLIANRRSASRTTTPAGAPRSNDRIFLPPAYFPPDLSSPLASDCGTAWVSGFVRRPPSLPCSPSLPRGRDTRVRARVSARGDTARMRRGEGPMTMRLRTGTAQTFGDLVLSKDFENVKRSISRCGTIR